MKRNFKVLMKKCALPVLVVLLMITVYLALLAPHSPNVKLERKYQGVIPVVVVEEHHEVLPHWYAAANSGILPKSGNVLVHIDGHSDMALTEIVPGYPLFRWPKNNYEISTLMQTNDAFIMAATGTGMFSKIIWVWPKWDSVNHNETATEMRTDIGWFYENDEDGVKTDTKGFCECLTVDDPKYFESNTDEKGRVCLSYDRNKFDPDGDYQGDVMKKKDCHIGQSAMTIEALETTFLDHLGGDLVKDDGQLILDIDEDFFGTESGVTVLLQSGINWKTVSQIDKLLATMVCPKTTIDEKEGDRLFTEVIKLVIKQCKTQSECDTGKATRLATALVKRWREEKKLKFFCRSDRRTFAVVKLLAKKLLTLSKEQLKVLINVGFCSSTTPKAYKGNEEDGYFDNPMFQICHGVNVPNETIVITHTPDDVEVNQRMDLLDRIVQHDGMPTPRVVTLCRSMRDGYTPKNYFHKIEAGVIDIIKRKLRGSNYELKYDLDLLGGQQGWPGRHSKWSDKL